MSSLLELLVEGIACSCSVFTFLSPWEHCFVNDAGFFLHSVGNFLVGFFASTVRTPPRFESVISWHGAPTSRNSENNSLCVCRFGVSGALSLPSVPSSTFAVAPFCRSPGENKFSKKNSLTLKESLNFFANF